MLNPLVVGHAYLPHHDVYSPAKPDTVRVVFDCAAHIVGVVLSMIVFIKGPN